MRFIIVVGDMVQYVLIQDSLEHAPDPLGFESLHIIDE